MSLMSDIGASVKTKLDTKVNKVTSTDNAIVRFDGTTGQVQNSGVIIDDNNNVGIGVTPSAWNTVTSHKSIQIGNGTSVASLFAGTYWNNSHVGLGTNFYTDSSDTSRYIGSSYASRYEQYIGKHIWTTAPSGTAGNAITWTTAMTLDASGNLQFNSGYGSVATAYGCRAWVNFNGAGTVAIRASGNVSSITDNGTGDYTVNFTSAMPDTNYSSVMNTTDSSASNTYYSFETYVVSTLSTSLRFQTTGNHYTGYSPMDRNLCRVTIFR